MFTIVSLPASAFGFACLLRLFVFMSSNCEIYNVYFIRSILHSDCKCVLHFGSAFKTSALSFIFLNLMLPCTQQLYVTFVVCDPQSWSNNDNYDAATSEKFSSANVVIDGPGLDTPTSRMQASGQCGQPGEFIQIPLDYMLGSLSEIVSKFGFPGMASR